MFYLIGPYPEPYLFIRSKNEIKAIDLLTVDTTCVVRGLKYHYSMPIATDPVDNKLYFTNGTNLARSRLDGTDTEVILKMVDPEDMAIDWIRRLIFWTQGNERKILVANLNGKDKKVLKLTQYRPRSIAVDPVVR